MLVMCTRFGDLITLIFVFTFHYMKFWTKSLYTVEKILLAKKNITKIFEKIQLFSKSLQRSDGGGTFRLHFWNLLKIWIQESESIDLNSIGFCQRYNIGWVTSVLEASLLLSLSQVRQSYS